MTLIRGINNLTSSLANSPAKIATPSAVSIGNYDGVHLGHQHVIKTLLANSERLQVPATVITFEPLAKEFFRPKSVTRITSVEERAYQLQRLGVEQVLCIDFNAEFASYSPQGFIDDVLLNGLGVKYLCVGDDFKFGKDRAGDFQLLKTIGQTQGFTVESHETFMLDGARVSSGRVRDALSAGHFDLAERLLGRRYCISGEVAEGQKLGRTIGFPTANIVLADYLHPVTGVYAVHAYVGGHGLADKRAIEGVANVGTRPTVDGLENRLEVHLFDFEEDIYGQTLQVDFLEKIREEQKFDSFELLKEQIVSDAQVARQLLSRIKQKRT